ncbi:hypothetical protein B296_00023662 [Ensete ventricosum]|uniref:Uncharacterized protein n=1 Tax=Ensete ventricosum TaxID=4639 RepID=A0A426ZS92_ENSVE|nr:hypothetical protein B296_00023662 [Ensete ventricosum]
MIISWMRTTPRPATYKPPVPPAPSRPSLPKKLTREDLRDRSVKGLCLHCDDRGAIYPPNTQVDEEAQVQLMIAWDRGIATHHHPDTTTNAGLQEHGAPSIGATGKPHKELQIRTQSHGVLTMRTRLI